jgi:hypothetical protein
MKKLNDFPWVSGLLVALAVLATAGYVYVSKTPPAVAADWTWTYPDTTGCYTRAADGFLVKLYKDGVPVKIDTVYTNRYPVPEEPGEYTLKAASFFQEGLVMTVGKEMSPDCTTLGDTLWSEPSLPAVVAVDENTGLVRDISMRFYAR